ncbi:MAG: DUF2400 family protein [Hymenobacter sp.]
MPKRPDSDSAPLHGSGQDIEISSAVCGAAGLGQRPTIISKCNELMRRMDDAPHQFVDPAPGRGLEAPAGLLPPHFLRHRLAVFRALPARLVRAARLAGNGVSDRRYPARAADELPQPLSSACPMRRGRTRKHVATPARKSACKRMNMYLRWLVRRDGRGVDFGLWTPPLARRPHHAHRRARRAPGPPVGPAHPQAGGLAGRRGTDRQPAPARPDRTR